MMVELPESAAHVATDPNRVYYVGAGGNPCRLPGLLSFHLTRPCRSLCRWLRSAHNMLDGLRQGLVRTCPKMVHPVLRKLFRGKLVANVRQAFRAGRLDFPGRLAPLKPEAAFRAFLRSLYRQSWVVYAKPPFGSPAHVLHYLARYTHRVAISHHRLVDVTHDAVSFRWKDYRHGSQIRTLTLAVDEFLRRFLVHVLPKRFSVSAISASSPHALGRRNSRSVVR